MNKDIDPSRLPKPEEVNPPIIIPVESQSDPNPPHVFGGLPAVQRQIDYQITVNNQKFIFPKVWAIQTMEVGEDGNEKTESYFSPEVGNFMSEAIFEFQHPELLILKNLG